MLAFFFVVVTLNVNGLQMSIFAFTPGNHKIRSLGSHHFFFDLWSTMTYRYARELWSKNFWNKQLAIYMLLLNSSFQKFILLALCWRHVCVCLSLSVYLSACPTKITKVRVVEFSIWIWTEWWCRSN